jgi:hypothetical protein
MQLHVIQLHGLLSLVWCWLWSCSRGDNVVSFDFSSIGKYFSQGNSSDSSTGSSGTAGGSGYSNASRSAAAAQQTPTIIVGGIKNTGAQSATTTPTLAASPEGIGGMFQGSGMNQTLMYVLAASILMALVVRR